MPNLDPSSNEEQPEPSAALSFVRVMSEAYVATLPKREALRFLSECASIFAGMEEAQNVIRIRRRDRDKQQAVADRQALAAFRRMLEVCIARLNAPPAEDEDT